MTTYSVSIHLFLEVRHCPEAEIADALQGILTEDIAASIVSIPLPDEYRPDDGAFPAWPARAVP